MTNKRRQQLIRNAVFRNIRKEKQWFKLIENYILNVYYTAPDFETIIESLLRDCKQFRATSVEKEIIQLVEKLTINEC